MRLMVPMWVYVTIGRSAVRRTQGVVGRAACVWWWLRVRRACVRDVRSAWYALVRLKSVKLGPTTALSMGERAKLPDVWQIAPASASRGSLGCERVCYKSAGESVLSRVRVPRHCLVGVVKWCEEDRSHLYCTNEEGRAPKMSNVHLYLLAL